MKASTLTQRVKLFKTLQELYQKLAQEAYAEDSPKYIETSFYAKMPPKASTQPSPSGNCIL